MPLTLTRRGKTGNYYIRGTVAGCHIYQSTGTSKKSAAEAIRHRTECQIIERVSLGRKATTTFAEAALNYMSAGGEARYLEKILRHFGPEKKLAEIDNQAVNHAAAVLYPNAKPATINRQLIVPISAVCRMAANDELCEARVFRRRKVTDKKTRWLTPEEFEIFARHLQPHLVPIIGFMIGSGARVGEALTLRAAALHSNTREALLTETKNGRARMVQYPGRAADMIAARCPGVGGVAFMTNRGEAYRITGKSGGQIKGSFDLARDAAGLGADVTPHTIRHTWATWYYSQTRDFGGLLDLGGWSSAAMANIYRKIAPDDLAERLLSHGWDYRRAGRIDARQYTPALRIVRNT